MKITLGITLTLISLICGGLADVGTTPTSGGEAQKKNTFPTPPAESLDRIKETVEITEIGCMRALVLLAKGSEDVEKQVIQALSDADFRIFPAFETVEAAKLDATLFEKMGNDRKADFIIAAEVSAAKQKSFGQFAIYEGEATVNVWSPKSGELLITHTSREKGERKADAKLAERSAREAVAGLAVREAITKMLEKAGRLMVYEAKLLNVQSQDHLLTILQHAATQKDIYHARQLNWDATTKVGIIEIIASPKSEPDWRAWMERLPKRTIPGSGTKPLDDTPAPVPQTKKKAEKPAAPEAKETMPAKSEAPSAVKINKNEEFRKKYPQFFK
jgi:hypothetical protein